LIQVIEISRQCRRRPAHKDAGFTRDEATPDRYIANPQAVVPRTAMLWAGPEDGEKRANPTACLATVH